jgi:acetoin utilization protein AcuB
MKNVGDIMTTRVVCVQMDDSLETVQRLFCSHGFHHLLVESRGSLAGIISDRDLLRALSPFSGTVIEQTRDEAVLRRRAHQIMTRDVICVQASTSIHEAAQLMLRHGISCLPVAEDKTAVVGLITWRDLLGYFLEDEPKDGSSCDR